MEIKSPDSDEQIGVVRFSEEINDPTTLISSICPRKLDNVMITTGKGGLSENPTQILRAKSFWEDLRNFADVSTDLSRASNDKEVIEAKAWNINHKGNVELLSYVPQQNQQDYWALFNQCRK